MYKTLFYLLILILKKKKLKIKKNIINTLLLKNYKNLINI